MTDRPAPPIKPLPPLRVEPTAKGFRVMEGERPARTPAGADLDLPTRELAEAVANEIETARGEMKGGKMAMESLGLTRLAATALDRIAPKPAATARAILEYAETDLVCYRGDRNSDLRARQDAAWQPLLDWLAERFNARLTPVEGVMPAAQSPLALAALAAALEKYDPFTLSGLGLAVQTAGSLVIGLALVHGRLDAAKASACAEIDEAYQNELWGEDAEGVAKRKLRTGDIELAARFLMLLRTSTAGIQ